MPMDMILYSYFLKQSPQTSQHPKSFRIFVARNSSAYVAGGL